MKTRRQSRTAHEARERMTRMNDAAARVPLRMSWSGVSEVLLGSTSRSRSDSCTYSCRGTTELLRAEREEDEDDEEVEEELN